MKNHYKIILFMLAMTLLQSCLEEIDIKEYAGQPTGTLVVEGLITNQKKAHKVRLTRTNEVITTNPATPVSGAEVYITDGFNIITLMEDSIGSGDYYTDSLVQGEIGKEYLLKIVADGKTYEAKDIMVPVPDWDQSDALGYAWHPTKDEGYIVRFLVQYDAAVPTMGTIEIENPEPGQKLKKMDYYNFTGVDPDNIRFENFQDGISIVSGKSRLIQTKFSLSQQHYLFSFAFITEAAFNGGIFGSQRANVPTNLTNGAKGYFGASAVLQKSFIPEK